MFHPLIYEEALAAGATAGDMDAVADDEFTRRNDHYIVTDPFNVLAMYYQAASAIRARLNVPEVNAIARHQIWPVFRSATVPDDPRIQDFRSNLFPLSQNEEIAVEGANDLAMGTENSTCVIWIAPPTWNRNLPRGSQRLVIRATGATAGVAQSWSTLGALTFAENLRGGWYAIVGCECFDAGSLAFRFVFSKPYMYAGRKLRPGNLCMEALGNRPCLQINDTFGVWGYFHSFEPPQFQIYANATGASVQEFWIDVIYLGDRPPGF